MDEFDRDMLRIGSVRASSKCQQAPTCEKAGGHLAACHGEWMRLLREEVFKDLIALQKPVFDATYEIA
jgi:hypothetical protein